MKIVKRSKINTRVRFTRALWARWLARLNGEAPASPLAAGIAEQRRLLAEADARLAKVWP